MEQDTQPYQDALLEALRAGDSPRAHGVVAAMRSAGVPPIEIYLRVFTPSMITIGDLWERNELTVAEEHLATAIVERLIAELSPSFAELPGASQIGTALIGCVAGERHVLGARMLADLLRQHGWRVLDLGADIPIHDWVKLAVRFQADLVAISVNMADNLPAAQMLIAEVRAACPDTFILAGGAALDRGPEFARGLGANLYHPDPLAAVTLATADAALRQDARRQAGSES